LAILLILFSIMTSGCVTTDDKVKKSNGHYQEGLANFETDRQKAFISFQQAVQLNPQHKEAHYSLGHLYALQGKYPEAQEELQKALRIDPNYSEAHNHLGQVYEKLGRWPDAISSYRHALENPLYATPDMARYNLGLALVREGDYRAATQALEDALLVTPPTVPAAAIHLELARAYSRLGYHTQARDSLLRVSTLDRGGPYAAEAEKLMERLKP
jgi:Tfp pilus assembly protein PilF